MIWTDFNGNEHILSDKVALSLQQPDCKYLLPCGIYTLTSDLYTCALLKNIDMTVPKFVDDTTCKEDEHENNV